MPIIKEVQLCHEEMEWDHPGVADQELEEVVVPVEWEATARVQALAATVCAPAVALKRNTRLVSPALM